MKKRLDKITTITTGYSFRGAVPIDGNGDYRVLQVKDIDENGFIIESDLSPIDTTIKNSNTLVQENDILLSVRGTTTSGLKVGIYKYNDTKTIATSSLYILRVTDKSIFPEYLLYYLKSFYGQCALKSMMSGAVVRTILKKNLATLEIPILPISKQKYMINTMKNIINQKILLSKKTSLLQALADNIISIHQ